MANEASFSGGHGDRIFLCSGVARGSEEAPLSRQSSCKACQGLIISHLFPKPDIYVRPAAKGLQVSEHIPRKIYGVMWQMIDYSI